MLWFLVGLLTTKALTAPLQVANQFLVETKRGNLSTKSEIRIAVISSVFVIALWVFGAICAWFLALEAHI